jgi:hypothetical protein
MIYKLPIPHIHTAPIDHNNMPLLRLSMVRIFLGVADQTKKIALKGTLFCQILFHALSKKYNYSSLCKGFCNMLGHATYHKEKKIHPSCLQDHLLLLNLSMSQLHSGCLLRHRLLGLFMASPGVL